MAFLPCSVGPHANPFRNSLFYVARGGGLDMFRFRLRLCPGHRAVVQDNLAQYKVTPDDVALGWNDAPSECFACGQPIAELGDQMFVTGYPAQNEREDYWFRIHRDCSLPDWLAPE